MLRTIRVEKDFSRSPEGRTRADGPHSAQAFREDHLVPALQERGQVVIDLRGVPGYSYAFLEEAFGGLVKQHQYSPAELHKRLFIRTDVDVYEDCIWIAVDGVELPL